MGGGVLMTGVASLSWRFLGVDSSGKAGIAAQSEGCMKDATDENSDETADSVEISIELEDVEL
jgi:hypothetical protein